MAKPGQLPVYQAFQITAGLLLRSGLDQHLGNLALATV